MFEDDGDDDYEMDTNDMGLVRVRETVCRYVISL